MLQYHKQTIFETLGRKPIHPFPARMAPGIALGVLGDSATPLRVLDPMMGSGTVLAVAKSRGHRAYGIDVDPLAVLLAKVWTTSVKPTDVEKKATDVLNRAKIRFRSMRVAEAYPKNADDETRKFIRFWFDNYARKQLAALSFAISGVRSESIRDVLWCGFSRLIISKQSGASLAMDLSHSRPHKAFEKAPAKPFDHFLRSVSQVIDNCPNTNQKKVGPVSNIRLGDARSINIKSRTIDLVLTSPPYLNAIDYMRCSKFSLVWMGYSIAELRKIRSGSVGSEATGENLDSDSGIRRVLDRLKLRPKLNARDEKLLKTYVRDMRASVQEVARVLVPKGRAVYVVGDNTVRGTFIRNSSIIEVLAADAGLKCIDKHTRTIPPNRRYLPPPSASKGGKDLDARMRREVVLVFSKSAA